MLTSFNSTSRSMIPIESFILTTRSYSRNPRQAVDENPALEVRSMGIGNKH